ncbi:hypothetical protein PR003_g6769 [Phytophthora rubi]|uniref:Transmembrane protein n=1 Tax=Phytophthora rubi TaxID=129364 RepID=A0A6A3N722_9STRA|nr:hypothetical protein PR002_g4588 [Phytophthora rubi]KAE9347725.1 hypothetical protein PR003_g6769 [Phytophthora rubi]
MASRPPPSPDAIAAANAAAATSARPPPASSESNAPSITVHRALEASQCSDLDMCSARSNPSVSSFNSSTREMHRLAVSSAFFGPLSGATEAIDETSEDSEPPASQRSISSDRGSRRRRRRGSSTGGERLFQRVFRHRTAPESALTAEEQGDDQVTQTRTLRQQLSLPLDSPNRENETPEERARRRENRTLFEELVHLANTRQPVQLDAFKVRRNSRPRSSRGKALSAQLRRSGSAETHDVAEFSSSDEEEEESSDDERDVDDETINTELLEAYIAYSKSIGHEPNIQLNPAMIPLGAEHKPRDIREDKDEDDEIDDNFTQRASYIQDRPVLKEHQHLWTGFLGTRYSKRRGCVQFWTWLLIGVGVLLWLGISLSSLQLNEVLHLDAFTVQDVQITEDFTYLHFLEEVDFHLTYTVETPTGENQNASYFNALLLNEYEYAHYMDGEPFEYIAAGSTFRTTYAYLPHTYIDNTIKETMYFVMQPCYLERNPTADYCNTTQLPTSVYSSEKVYNLDQKKKMKKKAVWEHFNVTYLSVNPMPVACSSSGWLGGSYLLLFLPYLIITLFGLRIFQMVVHCESWQKNLERIYSRELNVPDNEVDYWQPMPWDRKVPKTKLCGPCCWKKFRRPFEPFYTWWRHENYFTWIFCPYRNERLSRGERALIVVCSLYITFYVLFIIVMLRDSWGADITIFTSVVLYAILISILPSAGKAIFKELFKLIFRQRRKYFRAKAAGGGDIKGFSFRLAFLLQFLVVVLLTLAQAPIFYIWAFRSCLFLKKFMWFGVLAAIMRMSLMGLVQDFVWYLIIKTWGWKDLCPYCTERIKHCDCFNDELLVLAVERVGPKWELIRVLDDLMAKQHHYDPQFALYTSEQLRERWEVLVERAEKHMEKIDKLRAYQEKKRLDALRHERVRRSVTSFLSFRGTMNPGQPGSGKQVNGDEDETTGRKSSEVDSTSSSTDETRNPESDVDIHVCSLREKKILELNNKIKLDTFEKHYDSNISEVFHSLTHSVQKLRRHGKHKHKSKSKSKGTSLEQIPEEGAPSDTEHETSRSKTQLGSAGSRSSDGETMWVFDTPAQRLERREEEKLQRKRAFRILNDYKIETVDNPEPAAPMLSPIFSRQGSMSAISTGAPLSTSRVSQQDSKKRPLLSTHRPASPRSEDLVILMPDEPKAKPIDKVNLDEMASGCVADDYDDDDDDDYPSDLERGNHAPRSGASDQPPPSTSRVYSVTERPQTFFRRVSASASAFAAWALNYDPNVKY